MFNFVDSWEDIAFAFLAVVCFIVFTWGYFSMFSSFLRNIGAKKYTKSNLLGLLVFSVSPLISVATIGVSVYQDSYSPVQDSYYISEPAKLMLEYSALQQATKALFNGQKDYSNVSGELLIDSQQIPAKYYADHKLISPYGKVEVKPTEDKQNFSVTFFDIPQSECTKFSNLMMNYNYQHGDYNRYLIGVNDEKIKDSDPPCKGNNKISIVTKWWVDVDPNP